MTRPITLFALAALIPVICTSSQAIGGISISIGAHWETGHPVGVIPRPPICRPKVQPRGPRHPGPGKFWRHYHGCRIRVLPLTTRPLCPPTLVTRPPRPPRYGVISIWITNSNGSRTEVKLTRRDTGFIGPRREYYHHLPTHRQLHAVYGF